MLTLLLVYTTRFLYYYIVEQNYKQDHYPLLAQASFPRDLTLSLFRSLCGQSEL